MSVENVNIIDLMGLDQQSDCVKLTISDHLPWNENTDYHILKLQGKINHYLSFIESGELHEEYPLYLGKNIVISVVGKYELTEYADKFYLYARNLVKNAGYEIKFSRLN